ncbi:SDR family NAD(P)-dependent oxidoreductase [Shimazuella kribbensis]|uniref:SDR family NAD(P)-dependent oxidoreductase n=1 Tax=Shimazuella kribbensis TaxID=139808 RepID=UPI0004182C5D|nr:SDR family NAD(P)-dependent oxidoreductase [Shimazuella kribbensis]
MKTNTTTKKWTVENKYILITGATSGIGLAAAKEMALQGAQLGLIVRNEKKAQAVVDEIKQLTNGKRIPQIFVGDMSSQLSIQQVANKILDTCPKIDILIHNAGAMFVTQQITEDGIEKTWAVNHLAPFLLTELLLDRLKESEHARIITTASHGHKMAKKGMDLDDVRADKLYKGWNSLLGGANLRYGQSKLANILFTSQLAKIVADTNIHTYCYDPGLVATNFNQENGALARATMAVMKLFSRTPEKGAETMVWLADSDEVSDQSGLYYLDKKAIEPALIGQDQNLAQRLWETSEKQIRIT